MLRALAEDSFIPTVCPVGSVQNRIDFLCSDPFLRFFRRIRRQPYTLRCEGVRFRKISRQMHAGFHLVPWHNPALPLNAEHRIRCVAFVVLRLIPRGCHKLLLIVTGAIALQNKRHSSSSFCICVQLLLILLHRSHRHRSGKNRRISFCQGRIQLSIALFHIRHCPADHVRRHLQTETIERL